jgi:5-hydroxyisourate hydrolase
MAALSTHVLDTSRGMPAAGIPVQLRSVASPAPAGAPLPGALLGEGLTDDDGRVATLGPERLEAGDYVIRFDTSAYFAGSGQPGFYPEVTVTFTVADPDQHYHVPLLLSPFGYATYRGS